MEDKGMIEEIHHLKFLEKKSKQAIDIQVGSYRQQHTYAGTVIGITFIFIPFFLSGMTDTTLALQLLSIIPIMLFFAGLLLLLSIFRSKSLDQAIAIGKYDELLKKTYKETLLFIIETNTRSFHHNKVLAARANKRYDRGIKLTILAMLISIVLLLIHSFYKMPRPELKNPLGILSALELKPLVGMFSIIST